VATESARSPRTYQLFIEIAAPVRVTIGRLGSFDFPAGRYVYTGSALRNFEARIARHLSRDKKMHWHIDYLLAAPGVTVREVARFVETECLVNQAVGGEIVAPGFGASDCRKACGSHLQRLRSLQS
jgi:Uri superfamily endonuclease